MKTLRSRVGLCFGLDPVAGAHSNRAFNGVFHGPQRAAKGNEDATQPVWGRPSGLPPGFRPARNFTSAGSAGDLVAGVLTNRVFRVVFGRVSNLFPIPPCCRRRCGNWR